MPNDAPPARLLTLVRRPTDMVEATRWLFAVFALVSLLISLPAPLSSAGGTLLLVAFGCSCVLAASWVRGYAHRTAPVTSDLVDAVAIGWFALACPEPGGALGVVFGSLWFRSLYGSTGRAVLRAAAYVGALLATLPLWQLVPGNSEPASSAGLLSAIPTMFVTVIVGRHLAAVLHAREQAARRDAVLAAAGTRLLGVTDPDEIRAVAWAAIGEIAVASHGLRVVRVVDDAGTLRVGGRPAPHCSATTPCRTRFLPTCWRRATAAPRLRTTGPCSTPPWACAASGPRCPSAIPPTSPATCGCCSGRPRGCLPRSPSRSSRSPPRSRWPCAAARCTGS